MGWATLECHTYGQWSLVSLVSPDWMTRNHPVGVEEVGGKAAGTVYAPPVGTQEAGGISGRPAVGTQELE